MLNFQKIINERKNTIIATDFDGTISEVTNSPTTAQINKESKLLLSKLSQHYATVAVISGRPVKQLAHLVDLKNINYVGNHGAEFLSDNLYIVNSSAKPIQKQLISIANKLNYLKDEGFEIENKDFSLSLHFRNHQNPILAEQKLLTILEKYKTPTIKIQKGRKVFDICSKTINKGDAVIHLFNENKINNFLYIGDDKTDIDAFNKMDELAEKGVNIYKIALLSDESPEGLFENSDYKFNTISEVNNVFKKLLPPT